MNWLELLLIFAVLVGVAAGTALVIRNPVFWAGLGTAVFKQLMPLLLKRMPPEKEKEWRDCIKRGGEWDYVRKRCKR